MWLVHRISEKVPYFGVSLVNLSQCNAHCMSCLSIYSRVILGSLQYSKFGPQTPTTTATTKSCSIHLWVFIITSEANRIAEYNFLGVKFWLFPTPSGRNHTILRVYPDGKSRQKSRSHTCDPRSHAFVVEGPVKG